MLEPEAWEESHDAATFWAHELTTALVTHTRSSRQVWLTLQQKCLWTQWITEKDKTKNE